MKHYTSRFLKSVALFYMAFPAAYLLLCAMIFDVPMHACVRLLLSPWYYVLSILAITTGYGFWEMRRWSWYLFVTVNVLVGYENAVLASESGETHHKALAFIFSLGLLVLVTRRVAREIRVPYFFPKIRWWESDPRYRLSVPASIGRPSLENDSGQAQSTPVTGDILDLSMGGCFVKLRSDLGQDERVDLEFTVFKIPVRCQGTIVWATQSTVTHPKGIGIKFLDLGRQERRALKLIQRRLKHISNFYRRSRYLLNQDEFVRRLQELETMPLHKRKSRDSQAV